MIVLVISPNFLHTDTPPPLSIFSLLRLLCMCADIEHRDSPNRYARLHCSMLQHARNGRLASRPFTHFYGLAVKTGSIAL